MANSRIRRIAIRSDDSGFTLVELIVAMAVFAIFLTMLIASVIGITRASSRAQLLTQSSSSVLAVFQNLDRQIRYANAINFPGTGASGARYVEFRTGSDSSSSGVTTCTQWRFNPTTKTIQSRQWPDVTGATATAWSTKITTVVNLGGATYPFQMIPAAVNGSAMQQLVLSVSSGTDLTTPGAAISTTFVARNSSIQSPSNSNVVVAGTSDTPVCLATGSRP
jgi:prepilin-type N-terminal cleavage/methylation domain-containing protein